MREHGTAHHDGNLLNNLFAGVTRLPRLFAAADGLKEGKERRDTKGRCNVRECTSSHIANIFISMIDIGAHGGDHVGKTSCF